MPTTFAATRPYGPAQPASGTSTLITVTSGHTLTLRTIIISNNTANAINIKIGIGGVADANLILPLTTILGGDELVFEVAMLVLAQTETLQANLSNSGLTVTVNGVDAS